MATISGLNNVNYNHCVSWNSLSGHVSNVGQNGDPSFWGTYDQGGNALEWTEEQTYLGGNSEYQFSKMAYGGSWASNTSGISSNNYGQYTRPALNNPLFYNSLNATNENGFRVFSYTNPLNLPNFVTVSGVNNQSQNLPKGNIYGIDKDNNIWRIQLDAQQIVKVMSTGLSLPTGSNAIAYNNQTNHLIFMYYGAGALPFGLPGNNGSGLYSVKINYDINNIPSLTNISGVSGWNNAITKPIYNASYWNSSNGSGGYWFMSESTGVLSKISFTSTSNNGLAVSGNSFASFTLPTINILPNLYDNQFGDISISGSSNKGVLYATTKFGFLYCFDLTPTISGQNPVYITGARITGDATGRTLQTTFDHNNSVLYGHSYDNQSWYTINTELNNNFGQTILVKDNNNNDILLPKLTDMCGGTTSSIGSVSGTYKVASYEITNQEYVDFLNSVDPLGQQAQLEVSDNGYNQNAAISTGILYTSLMASDRGGISYIASKDSGQKYVVNRYMHNKPAVFITWPMAARYCNWLHNRVSNPSSTTTSTGAYNFTDVSYDGGVCNNSGLTRSPTAKYFLPNANEWYKAAYYSLDRLEPDQYHLNSGDQGASQSITVLGYPSPVATGWSVASGSIADSTKIFGKVESITPAYEEPYWNITVDAGAFMYNNDYTFFMPSGYDLYSTQQNSVPNCPDTDQYGEGPKLINQIQQIVFNGLRVGDSYTVNLSVTKPDKYDAFLPIDTINFIASDVSETIMVPVTRYSNVLAVVLSTQLIQNNGSVIIEEKTHIVTCQQSNSSCFTRLPRTPLPTNTRTPTATPTPSKTPVNTYSPTPTRTVTRTMTATNTVTPTYTPTTTPTPSNIPDSIYACNFVDTSNIFETLSGNYVKSGNIYYKSANNLSYKIFYNGVSSRWELTNNAGNLVFYYSTSMFGSWRSGSALTQYPLNSLGFWEIRTSECDNNDSFL
jgi:hypothetical protein